MAEEFDIGPLTWVKDEIDQALKSVLENLATVSANPEDLAALRFSKTHLYQVSGALDMVGLEGCKRFCAEIEKLVDKLEKNTIAVSPEVLQTLNQSVKALSNYLQDLLNGSPDTPTQLFPALQAMVEAQGETVEESELFFPDTSLRAPKDLPTTQLDEAALPGYFAEQRANFQKSLLLWMKDANPEGADGMRAAIENVQKVQQQPAQKTLWWAASAFMDVLSQSAIAANAGVKRLCRRLDQQLKSLSESASRASGNLLRDVLYYVAISTPTSDRVTKVKDVFELDNLLPNAMNFASGEISEAELQVVNQLKSILPTLKGVWDSISEGKVDALDGFLRQLDSTVALSQNLTNTAVTKLFACIQELTANLDSKAKKIGEIALIEVAAGLNLLEDTLQNYADQNGKTIRLLATQSQRLQDVMSGAMTDTSVTSMPALDSDVLLAVTQQIKDALQLAEQELDTYFRNPAEPQVLQAAEKPLQQVAAAFDMLGMTVPMQIASACLTFIGHFRNQAKELNVEASQAQFELVAESLGMLEFYSKELPRSRPEFYATLEAVLDSLKDNLQQLGLPTELEPQAAKSSAKKAGKVSVPESAEPGEAAAVAAEEITDQAFDAELLDIYLTEAEEVLAHIAQNLQALRVNATDHAALVEVRRGYHTLKGSGRTVGLAALGEVAWAVEKLLNLVMDTKATPSAGQLSFIEKINAAFAGWVSTLRETGSVTLAPEPWRQQATALENENATPETAVAAEEVVIGGTYKISRALFTIFCGEADRHMQVLKQYFSSLAVGDPPDQNEDSRRVAHTLASNAGAVGFKPIAEIARALEIWLEAYQEPWSKKTLALFGKALKTLETMLGKAN
ncbi:MAG TPA: Hpt domain-containing protein, partial [Methylophilaceae bacterium]|nr:Hpt domain-containing protein [Methylophilaceae bacterium]